MTQNHVLVRIMDEAANRVLSGTERPYIVAMEASADLIHLAPNDQSVASWTAQVQWLEFTDIVDFLDSPGAEPLCDELAVEFSRTWLDLPDRETESAQVAFLTDFYAVFSERVSQYRNAH